MKTASEMVIIKVDIYPLSMTLFWCLYCSLWTDSHLVLVMLTLLTLSWKMPAKCGNDNDGNSHDEDVDATDFITAWKIYYFFEMDAKGQGIRAEGWGSRKTKSRNWRKVPPYKQTLLYNRCNKEKYFTFVLRRTIINRIISIANKWS